MQITKNTVAVTGANRGIGLALASMFATEKNNLILLNRKADPALEKRFLELGALTVKTIPVDLSDIMQTEKIANELAKMNIDVLVNNAGLLTGGQLETQTTQEIVDMFNVNLVSLVLLTKAVIPGMVKRRRGKIINNASVSGKMFLPSANTYSASKAGVVGFTESLKVELQGAGVTTLLLITPGIKTDMFDQISEKYSSNMDVSGLSAISASQWAQEVKLAFINDDARLYPKGITRLGVFVGHHFPDVLGRLVATRFKRIN